MSLVNDMLRDLDKRRKDTEGSAAGLRLFPASEDVNLQKSRMSYYIVFGLILAVAGLGYAWAQLNQGSGPRSLDIRAELVQTTDESVFANESEAGQAGEASSEQTQTGDIEQVLANAIIANASSENQEISQPDFAQSATETIPDAASVASQRVGADTATVSSPEAGAERVEDSNIASVEPGNVFDAADSKPAVIGTVSLIRSVADGEGPSESIKDAAVLTPPQQDVQAVQEALRLIARNQTDAAYTTLAEHIAVNRYAHQSRETYAKLLMSQGDPDRAYELIENGLQLAPNHHGFKKIRARLMIADGELDGAVELLLSRAPEVSNDIEYHELLALAQLASRDYEGASISYTGLVGQDRSQGKWWYGFATSQESLGNTRVARQAYNRAIRQSNLSASLRQRSQQRLNSLGP